MNLYDTIRLALKKKEFKKIIFQILHLYNLETKRIADSVKLPLFLRPAQTSIIKKLYYTMKDVAITLSERWSSKIFNGDPWIKVVS